MNAKTLLPLAAGGVLAVMGAEWVAGTSFYATAVAAARAKSPGDPLTEGIGKLYRFAGAAAGIAVAALVFGSIKAPTT